MNDWLVTVLSIGSSCIITTTIGIIIKRMLGKKFEEQEELNNLRAEKEKRERLEDILATIKQEVSPINKKITEINSNLEHVASGTQAVLRHNLYQIYDHWMPLGYCPRESKINFQNLYDNYHSLGKNGVMDDYRTKLLDLPDRQPEE